MILAEKSVGIKDVARHAGVSISTVSNVLNGTRPVSLALTKRVMKAVKELNYETNLVGRQLKTGKSQQIAVVIPSITSIFFPNLLKSIQVAADKEDYTVSIFNTKGDINQERRVINLLRSRNYDGVMLSSCADVDRIETAEYLDFLHAINFSSQPMHIICLEAAISSKLDAVVVNDLEGTMKATNYLIESGRRNIAHIAAPNQYMMGKNRRRGFISSLLLKGLSVDDHLIVEGRYTCESGYEAMKQLLRTGRTIDAVVAGNDQMAIGAINYLKQQKIRIPEDIAVVGFNDNTPASLISPSLTTIHIPKEEMGAQAFELFMRRVNNDQSARMMICLEGELVIRNSTDTGVKVEWDMNW